MPRLRRAAHKTLRRGASRSPCPRSLRSLAGSTPWGDAVPHGLWPRLPLFGLQKGERFFAKAFLRFSQRPAGEDGDLPANRHRNPQPPRGRNARYGVFGFGPAQAPGEGGVGGEGAAFLGRRFFRFSLWACWGYPRSSAQILWIRWQLPSPFPGCPVIGQKCP